MASGDSHNSQNESSVTRVFPPLSGSSIVKKPVKYLETVKKSQAHLHDRNTISTEPTATNLTSLAKRSALLFKPAAVLKKQQHQSQYKSRALSSPIVFCRESSNEGINRPVSALTSMYGNAGSNKKRHVKSKNGLSYRMALARELGLYKDNDYGNHQHNYNDKKTKNYTNFNTGNGSNGAVKDEEYWDAPYNPFQPTDYKRYKESDEYLIEQHEWNLFLVEKGYIAEQRLPRSETISNMGHLDRTGSVVGERSLTPTGNYGRKILEKFGWKQGQGLGASEERQGIKTALRLAPVDRMKRKIGRIIDDNR
jgi:hypothetical protein